LPGVGTTIAGDIQATRAENTSRGVFFTSQRETNMMALRSKTRRILVCMGAAGIALGHGVPGRAAEGGAAEESKWQLNGFLSVIGGKIMSSENIGPLYTSNFRCPCYVGDYANGGVYELGAMQFRPESHVGVQVNYNVNPDLNLVGQLTVRGTVPRPVVQWAYANYAIADGWEVQVGRQRIPLFYYSDSQDIGVSLPWVSVPPEYYGWDALNFNAVKVRYQKNFGETNLNASLFVGREYVAESRFQKVFTANRSDATWSGIVGGDVEVNFGAVQVRAVYLQTNTSVHDQVTNFSLRTHLRSYGVAAKWNVNRWFSYLELAEQDNDYYESGFNVKAPGGAFGLGVHLGAFTPFVSYSRFREKPSDRTLWPSTLNQRRSVTLRYDVNASSAVKVQLGRFTDGAKNYGGDSKILQVSYDMVF
jgi:hypothetical protein